MIWREYMQYAKKAKESRLKIIDTPNGYAAVYSDALGNDMLRIVYKDGQIVDTAMEIKDFGYRGKS